MFSAQTSFWLIGTHTKTTRRKQAEKALGKLQMEEFGHTYVHIFTERRRGTESEENTQDYHFISSGQ